MYKWFVAIIISLSLLPVAAGAFSVSPLRYTVTVDPGKSVTSVVEIKNTEFVDQSYKMVVSGLSTNERGAIVYTTISEERKKWLQFDSAQFNLKNGQKKSVAVTAVVPPGTAPGSYTFAVIIEAAAGSGPSVSLTSRIAIPFVVQVAGEVTEAARIVGLEGLKNFITRPESTIDLVLKNEGTVNIAARGRVILKNSEAQEIAVKEVNMGSQVLVGSIRTVPVSMSLVHASVVLPSRYSIEAQVVYGESKTVIKSAATFWYVPKPFLGLLGVVVVGTIWLIKSMFSRKRKNSV